MLSPKEALVTLNLIPGLGSMRIQALLEYFGSAELVLNAPAQMLANVPRIGHRMAEAIADWKNCTNVQAELQYAADYGVRVITILDDEYPEYLRRMQDPPIVLYVRGSWRNNDIIAIDKMCTVEGVFELLTIYLSGHNSGGNISNAICARAYFTIFSNINGLVGINRNKGFILLVVVETITALITDKLTVVA